MRGLYGSLVKSVSYGSALVWHGPCHSRYSFFVKHMAHSARFLVVFLISSIFFLAGDLPARKASAGEGPFPRPHGLEEWVEFWKLVFTQYGSTELIFFDSLEPTTIYKVLDVGENRRTRRLIRRERKKIAAKHGINRERVSVQRGAKDRFRLGLERSRRYLDQMQEIFQEEGLPVELTYLPLIESSFDTRVRSSAGAVGIWQFMRTTGRKYLRVNRRMDERRDPLESTRAAARLLKENYELFGSWPLAVTAYNHGRRGISRAVARVGSSDLEEIIRNYKGRSFGFASKNFYVEFLAAVDIAKQAEDFFPGLEYRPPFPIEEFETERAIPLAPLVKQGGASRKEFLEWNPALSRRARTIPRGYRVKVPREKLEAFATAYQNILETASIRHRVRSGETLSEIADRYRTTVREIKEANGLRSIHFISVGQVLEVPRL
jgi:membrane-bound lytic murein transglycosylase D